MCPDNQELFTEKELQWLLTDLSQKSVGISGGGLFKINYTFLGHVSSFFIDKLHEKISH